MEKELNIIPKKERGCKNSPETGAPVTIVAGAP